MNRIIGIKLAMAIIALAVLLLPAAPAQAACSLSISQTTPLNWSTWQKPSGSVTADITTADALSGTGTHLYGTAAHGVFSITSNPQCSGTITITVADNGGATGVTLSNFHLVYNGSSVANGTSGLTLPGSSGKQLLVGATATYDNTVSTSTESPTLKITVLESGHSVSTSPSETASISFDVPLTLTKTSDIDFGTVSANNASTYRISTAGTTSVVSGTGQFFSGTPTASSITVAGSTTDTITIQATGYTANNGVTPSNATCSYNGAASQACSSAITGAAPGAGKTLLVGVDVATDGTQAINTSAAPTFTINVNYQ